jgi:hypothetical protein
MKNLHTPLTNIALVISALAISALPLAAQTSYHYTGKPFTFFSCGPSSPGPGTRDCPNDPAPGNTLTSYTATDHVTATLTFTSPLSASLFYTDVTTVPGFKLTMNDGHQTLTTPGPVIAKVSTDATGQIVGPWLLVINAGNAADSGIASENEPPVQPFVQDQGTLACCDPTIQGDIALNQNLAGTWDNTNQKTPVQMLSDLVVVIQQMNIPKQGTSLIDKLQQISTDITAQNGLACPDLTAFMNQLKAQTGKTITTGQASQLVTATAAIQTAVGCGA